MAATLDHTFEATPMYYRVLWGNVFTSTLTPSMTYAMIAQVPTVGTQRSTSWREGISDQHQKKLECAESVQSLQRGIAFFISLIYKLEEKYCTTDAMPLPACRCIPSNGGNLQTSR